MCGKNVLNRQYNSVDECAQLVNNFVIQAYKVWVVPTFVILSTIFYSTNQPVFPLRLSLKITDVGT